MSTAGSKFTPRKKSYAVTEPRVLGMLACIVIGLIVFMGLCLILLNDMKQTEKNEEMVQRRHSRYEVGRCYKS